MASIREGHGLPELPNDPNENELLLGVAGLNARSRIGSLNENQLKPSRWAFQSARMQFVFIRVIRQFRLFVAPPPQSFPWALFSIAVLASACGEQQRGSRDTSDATPAPPVAARDSQVTWRVRPILNAPRYFVLSDWVSDATLWGLAGENPVDIDVRTGAGTAWGVRASGARRSPDGSALAWSDPSGLWIMRRAGRPRRILTYASIPQVPAGDPTNEIRWAPNGRRLLTSWRDEGNVTHVVVDTTSGGFEVVNTRRAGYGEAAGALWLDDRRILFTTAANAAKDGSAGYREAGWRADIAVHDLGTHTYEKVTDVPDGVFLELLGAFGDTVLARRRATGDSAATFSLLDARTWLETPSGLPTGSTAAVSRDGARAAVLRSNDTMSEVIVRSRRPGVPHAAPLFIPGRVTGAAWSPNGRMLAISTMQEEPVAGSPNDRRAVYRLSVVEP